MEKKLICLDLEMTGLDPNAERIIEIFTAVTNEDLTEIIDGPNLVAVSYTHLTLPTTTSV